jgi:hypothetical protein
MCPNHRLEEPSLGYFPLSGVSPVFPFTYYYAESTRCSGSPTTEDRLNSTIFLSVPTIPFAMVVDDSLPIRPITIPKVA